MLLEISSLSIFSYFTYPFTIAVFSVILSGSNYSVTLESSECLECFLLLFKCPIFKMHTVILCIRQSLKANCWPTPQHHTVVYNVSNAPKEFKTLQKKRSRPSGRTNLIQKVNLCQRGRFLFRLTEISIWPRFNPSLIRIRFHWKRRGWFDFFIKTFIYPLPFIVINSLLWNLKISDRFGVWKLHRPL